MLCFKGSARLVTALALTVFTIVTAACSGPAQLKPSSVKAGTAAQASPALPTSSENTSPAQPPIIPVQAAASENSTDNTTASVRILQVHFRGALQPLGCCNNDLYEKDEFVAIQNTGKTPQNIAGWKLVNANKNWAVFVFPEHYPCIAFKPYDEHKYAANIYNYTSNAPQTIGQIFALSKSGDTGQQYEVPVPSQIDWSSCLPVDPLDETPMPPLEGQEQGFVQPCILYPGQIILVFTDEIHCQYGGLTFHYGLGDLWNNEIADTAVLYDSTGREVSRRSYTLGR